MQSFYNLVSRKYAVFWNVNQHVSSESYFYLFDVTYCALCAQNRGKPLSKTSSHFAQSYCSTNTDFQRSQNYEYLLNAKNALQKYINLTWFPW